MDKLRAMQTFVRIVEGGSLTAAAESMRVSLPSVVRGLAALEQSLDVRLLNRTTRRLALTDEGREYYERAKRVLADVDEAEAALSARRTQPKGRLRVTASVLFGRLHVAPAVSAFVVRHPAVSVELVLLDRPVDLIEEGIDLGVRIGALPDSSLVAVPVGETRRVVCASPAYLERHGAPAEPGDLAAHRCIGFTGLCARPRMDLPGGGAPASGHGLARVLVEPDRRGAPGLPGRAGPGAVPLLPGERRARRGRARARARVVRAAAVAGQPDLSRVAAALVERPLAGGLDGAAAAALACRRARRARSEREAHITSVDTRA